LFSVGRLFVQVSVGIYIFSPKLAGFSPLNSSYYGSAKDKIYRVLQNARIHQRTQPPLTQKSATKTVSLSTHKSTTKKNYVAANPEICSENHVATDPEISSENCVVVDAEIGSDDGVVSSFTFFFVGCLISLNSKLI
jgi:hypothetical protein